MMEHVHIWKKSHRKHKRPPRFFVFCEDPNCPDGPGEWQKTPTSEPFRTNRKRGRMDSHSIRLSRKPTRTEVKKIQEFIKEKAPE
jgi:hypothetical protein